MKQTLLCSLFLGIVYLTLSSNKTGPAHSGTGDKTGRLGATVTCAENCHKDWGTGPIGTTTCTIELRRKDLGTGSAPATGYIAGKTYIVTISGHNSISLPLYGFQLTATIGNATAGTFSNFPANVGQSAVGGVTLVEHTAPLSGTSGNYATSFEWTAPSSGNTPITFWGIINAVDGNNAYNNDAPSAGIALVLQHTTAVGAFAAEHNVSIYPNPFTNNLNVKVGNVKSGSYIINVFDLNGLKLIEQDRIIPPGTSQAFRTDIWPCGFYFVRVSKDDHSEIIPVVKR